MKESWQESEFEAIFREYHVRILRLTRRVLRSDAEAEEVCAEAFFRLYRAGPEVAMDGQVGGWLYRTATRAAIDLLRSHQRRGGHEPLNAEHLQVEEELGDSPLHQLLREERVSAVRAALAQLKRKKAQLLLLRHSGLSYQEIAQAMKLNTNSVGRALARAAEDFSVIYERQQRRNRAITQFEAAKEQR